MDATKKRKAEENGATAPLTTTDAQKLLAPLSVDQLREILQSAIVRHADILDDVRTIADRDSTLRKLFVRGLAADTTTETLKALFSTYGELGEAVVITDKGTGKSKGYGFVTFKHVDGAILALKEPSKKIDGRVTVSQLATAGKDSSGGDLSLRKIYVGNVPFEVTSERLLEYFSMFGEIEEGPLGFDKTSGKPRGFAFFVYKSEEGAKAAVAEPMKVVDGHQVMCKFAVDNKKVKPGSGPGGGIQGPGSQGGAVPGSGSYSGFGGPAGMGGYQGGPGMGGGGGGYGYNSAMPPVVGGPGSQMMGSVNAGMGGGYGGSQYGGSGPGFGDYGGMNNQGSYMQRGPPGSMGMPSGGYPDVGHGGLGSSGFPSQPQQPPRVPSGGMYQGPPPYY